MRALLLPLVGFVVVASVNAQVYPPTPGSGSSTPVTVGNFPVTQPVRNQGGAPADYSVNAAAVPMSGFVLLATIPASATRAAVEVQNQSAGAIQVIRDDGSATAGTVSSILLAGGTAAGTQGGGWSSTTFKGRVLIYGASGSQVSAFQE